MQIIKPEKLKAGDSIGIVAPATSASLISKRNLDMAKKKLESFGLNVIYGKNIFKHHKLSIDGIKERINDLHSMFSSKKIKGIMAVIGGYSSNQLLPYLDYDLIRKNPKVFVGYSDITALQNAIFQKTGLITFSGPCFASFAQTHSPCEFEEEYFKKILMGRDFNVKLRPSKIWADDEWWKTPEKKRELKRNNGWKYIKKGKAKGIIIGGNLSTFLLLLGTAYLPDLRNKILFIEEDPEMNRGMIERMFTQLSQNNYFNKISGLVIGRFSSKTNFSEKEEKKFLQTITLGLDIPVISNLDFGHTSPIITFPIGGTCEIDTSKNLIRLGY